MEFQQPQQAQPQHLWSVFKVEDAFGPVSFGGGNRIKRVWFHVVGMPDTYIEVSLDDFMNTGKVASEIEAHVEAMFNASTLKSTETI